MKFHHIRFPITSIKNNNNISRFRTNYYYPLNNLSSKSSFSSLLNTNRFHAQTQLQQVSRHQQVQQTSHSTIQTPKLSPKTFYSTMSKEPCSACKTVPPVVAKDYNEKGEYQQWETGHKTYVVHPSPQPTTGVLYIYDIFGFTPQTMQGADILAVTVPGQIVVVPDFFHGKPYPMNNYPPDTEEKKKAFGEFFSGPADVKTTVATAHKLLVEAKTKYPSVKSWGVVGFCWGGKVSTVLSTQDVVAASAQCHPAMLDAKDVENLKVPHMCLASKDEDAEEVKKFKDALSKDSKSQVETFSNDVHGWMAARADLEKKAEAESYQKGYEKLIEFFKNNLKA